MNSELTQAEIEILKSEYGSLRYKPLLQAVIGKILKANKYQNGDIVCTTMSRNHLKGSYGKIIDTYYGGDTVPNVTIRFSDAVDDTENYNINEIKLIYRTI
jgi:hypothetical protein|nr:MAG TPA: hypothetical protein [Caudoviricetes sp.]